jgi:hypothetical protein
VLGPAAQRLATTEVPPLGPNAWEEQVNLPTPLQHGEIISTRTEYRQVAVTPPEIICARTKTCAVVEACPPQPVCAPVCAPTVTTKRSHFLRFGLGPLLDLGIL